MQQNADAGPGRYLCRETMAALPAGDTMAVPPDRVRAPEGCFLDVTGMRLARAGLGLAEATMPVRPLHLNQAGVVQGGVLAAFGDAVAGWASLAALPASKRFSTVAFSTNLAGAVRLGQTLVGQARVLHAGGSTMVVQADIYREDTSATPARRLVATFTCTQLVLAG